MESPVLDKVRKLLARTTEANCTQAEADVAMATASRLLTEHNLTMADIAKSNFSSEFYVEEFVFQTGRWSVQHNMALSIVSEFCFVKGLFYSGNGRERKVRKLYLFGLRENVETAKFMFGAILSAFGYLFDNYRARTCCDVKEKYSFTSGVADGFADKMRAERHKVEDEQDKLQLKTSGSTEIILRSIMEKTVEQFTKKHPNLKSSNINFGASYGSNESRNAGYCEGQRLNLRKGIR